MASIFERIGILGFTKMFRMRGDAQKVFEALYCMFWVYISHSVIVKLNLFALFATTFKSNNDTKCDRSDTLIIYCSNRFVAKDSIKDIEFS